MSDDRICINAPLEDVRREIWEGDLLIFRNKNGRPCRVAKAAWWDDVLLWLEVKRFQGVTAVPLEQLVRYHPGRIDVYEVDPGKAPPDYDGRAVTRVMKNCVLDRASYRDVLSRAVRALFAKLFNRTTRKTIASPYGADAIRRAERDGGGVDPVPDLPDGDVRPRDLESSSFYRYRFTLR